MRFITNLLPLLRRAPHLHRVVSVAGGGCEGPLDPSDFPALRVPLRALRGHLCTLQTLGLEAVAKMAPEVGFVHDYPGTVDTGLAGRRAGLMAMVIRAYIYFLGRWVCVPVEEAGERHLYLATSAMYPAASRGGTAGSESGVPLGKDVEVMRGTIGVVGSGVYSVGWDGESCSPAVRELLAGLRDKGMVDELWRHTQGEYKRVTGREGKS